MAKVKRVKRQWLRRHGEVVLAVPGPLTANSAEFTNIGLIDPEVELSTDARLLRVIWSASAVLFRDGSFHGTIELGLARCSLAVPPNGLTAAGVEDGDKDWLYRDFFTMGVRAEYLGTDGHFDLHIANDDWKGDWRIHGGKGASIGNDGGFRYFVGLWSSDPATTTGNVIPNNAGSVYIQLSVLELWEG